jgi:hypothetical protein
MDNVIEWVDLGGCELHNNFAYASSKLQPGQTIVVMYNSNKVGIAAATPAEREEDK